MSAVKDMIKNAIESMDRVNAMKDLIEKISSGHVATMKDFEGMEGSFDCGIFLSVSPDSQIKLIKVLLDVIKDIKSIIEVYDVEASSDEEDLDLLLELGTIGAKAITAAIEGDDGIQRDIEALDIENL